MPGQPDDAIGTVPILDPAHLAEADEDADWDGGDEVALRYAIPEAIRKTWNAWRDMSAPAADTPGTDTPEETA
jgi:hypothetical protein